MGKVYKVLFISHSASRTGAPKYLLNLIEYLKNNLNIQVTTLLLESGALENDFRNLGKVTILPILPFPASPLLRVADRAFQIFERKGKNLFKTFEVMEFDFIYANSAASSSAAIKIKKQLRLPLIIHVHELQMMIKLYCGEENFKIAIETADKIIAVSTLVQKMLIKDYKISPEKITKVYVPINTNFEPVFVRDKVSFVVVGSGNLHWIKGPDIFVQIAKLFFILSPKSNVVFKWVGGEKESYEYQLLIHDIDIAGLTDRVIITGEVHNPKKYFREANVLLITSREDTFPTVGLENAFEGNPIICFNETTGLSEIINSHNGLKVEFLDLNSIVEELNKLIYDYEYYQMKSMNIHRMSENFSVEKVCLPILNEIKKILE